MRTFYWRGVPNFGDVLARDLVQALTPHRVTWAPAASAELVVTGSIATMLPPGFAGTVLGIGVARPVPVDLSAARVLALRGFRTLEWADVTGDREPGRLALGDPGLLAECLLEKRPRVDHAVGAVAHWQDRDLAKRWPSALRIDVRRDPAYVVRQIARCERIVSSSLHGIVVADALGIPRRWETFDRVQGGGFKFLDHASVVGHIEPGEWGEADPDTTRRAKVGLLAAFSQL